MRAWDITYLPSAARGRFWYLYATLAELLVSEPVRAWVASLGGAADLCAAREVCGVMPSVALAWLYELKQRRTLVAALARGPCDRTNVEYFRILHLAASHRMLMSRARSTRWSTRVRRATFTAVTLLAQPTTSAIPEKLRV